MSEKIDELIEELIDDVEYAETYPSARSRLARNISRSKLRTEISKMDAVIEAAKAWEHLPHFNTVLKLRAAVRAIEEMEKSHE